MAMSTERLLDDLARLVEVESPTGDIEACRQCADVVADLGHELLGAPPSQTSEAGRPFLRWSFGAPRVLLVGHLDTVWPRGTLARWPFRVDDGRATGPGAFDMKAGIVQLFHALAALEDFDGVSVVLSSDEETGSATSRQAIEAAALGCSAALVLEPSAGGTAATTTPCVGHDTRRVLACKYTWVVPRSRPRHRRGSLLRS